MRRDVCYFFPADVVSVYNGYIAAATNSRFRRECKEEPYHTINFGINFSMMYNMNGGSCTIHFIPYQGGTAVDLRFSIAQLAGARYEKYAKDLTEAAMAVIGVPAQIFKLDVEEFLKEGNKVTPQSVNAAVPVAHQPAPTPEPFAPAPTAETVTPPAQEKSCTNCGAALVDGAMFCSNCGTKVVTQRFCSQCGNAVSPEAAFCSNCGNKLQ